MKFSKFLFLVCVVISAPVSNATAIEEKAVENIFAVFGNRADSSWVRIAEPPADIMSLAISEQLQVNEMLRDTAPDTYASILAREKSAQFHSIYSFYNQTNNLYRVVWYYQWESGCDTSSFELSFSTYSENGSMPAAEIPLTGVGSHDAWCRVYEV